MADMGTREPLSFMCDYIPSDIGPSSWRLLQTTKLRFYWPGNLSQCAECSGCALRSKYHRQPKISIQTYPVVRVPLGRVHIYLT